ncbi:MAG TPA: PAS domain S-box protein [Rhodoferax sp.]|nr:PAS domain S-box protein [Rhodoferax sp.]HNV58155.1 PAS domain S-box protein [Rhodoferax sp.]
MKIQPLRWRSLKTRVILMALAVFVLSVLSLTFLTSQILRKDLEHLVGEQQFSAAAIIAAEIDQEIGDRIHALELVAQQIQPAHMAAPVKLRQLFAANPLLTTLFNGGAFVTNADATAIASVPEAVGRVGVNYRERDHIVTALKQGIPSVSEAVLGKMLKAPFVSLAVPVRNERQAVIGALVGVINLGQPNFLDFIIGHRYGITGGYMLVDPAHRQIVTATDKRFNLKPLPPLGADPVTDKYVEGFQGHGILVDALGVENISAGKSISTAKWIVVALFPTQEAFAPIASIQWKAFYLTLALTVLAGGLTWWVLRRELTPIISTAQTLARLSRSDTFPSALPVTRQDEVGDLIGGFNRLLEVLQQRESDRVNSEARFRALVDWLPVAMVVHDGQQVLFANPAAVQMLDGRSVTDVVGYPVMDMVHPSSMARAAEGARKLLQEGGTAGAVHYTFVSMTGRLVEVELRAIHIQYNGKPASQIVFQDITERVAAESRLRQLSRATEQSPIAVVISDLQGTIEYVNPQFESVTGYTLGEVLGRNPRILQSGRTERAVYVDLWNTLQAGETWTGEFRNRRKSGELFIEHAVIAPILDTSGAITHYVALKEDITEQMRRQDELQSALQEKTALLNEVHHRVKNNLQVITSLLRLESGRASAPDTRSVLNEMQGRIRSMALVHETLYRSGNFAGVELHRYLQQVATVAFRAQTMTGGSVRLVLDLNPVSVSLDLATPCGLLVNELISNCVKHGFAQGDSGEVRVSLHRADGASDTPALWCLRVSDTGVGLPADFEERRGQSLGLQLVSDLAGQIGGTLTTEPGPGATFSVTFPIASA